MNAVGSLITGLLALPAVRLFLEDLFLRVFSELWSSSKDPEFKHEFLELSSQLATAETEEAKRNVLKQIRALRSLG